MHARRTFEFINDRPGKLHRKRLGFALRQIDENIGHIIGLGSQVDAGNHVGLVLRLSKSCRFGVGSGLGKRIDGSAFGESLFARQSVGMNGNEKRSTARAREPYALGQWNKAVVRARHRDSVFSPAFKPLTKYL